MFHEDWYHDSQCQRLKQLVKSIKHIKEGDVIEIGCWEGKSTHHIANECYPQTVICVDSWMGNTEESLLTGVTHITEVVLKERDVYQTFLQNMNELTKQNYKVEKRDCFDWLNQYDGKIKFIHIDASHEYYSVKKTIDLVLPKMVSGGILCGDDFVGANINRSDLHGGVERAVRETLPRFHSIHNLWYYICP